MFGHHKARRAKRRLKEEKAELDKQQSDFKNDPEREKQASEMQSKQVAEKTAQAKADRTAAREEGRKYAEDIMSRDVQGLDPKRKAAMQYEANKGIQRSMQSANRKLLGDQSQRGIVGKGGVGYAQQRDLQRMAMDAQGQVQRDVDKLNEDQRMRNRAAMHTIESGEASQQQLDKQMALDELQLADEKKRQREFEDKFHRIFSRI